MHSFFNYLNHYSKIYPAKRSSINQFSNNTVDVDLTVYDCDAAFSRLGLDQNYGFVHDLDYFSNQEITILCIFICNSQVRLVFDLKIWSLNFDRWKSYYQIYNFSFVHCIDNLEDWLFKFFYFLFSSFSMDN